MPSKIEQNTCMQTPKREDIEEKIMNTPRYSISEGSTGQVNRQQRDTGQRIESSRHTG